jgi:DNA-binding CsgD family transcriptional regulator
MAAISQRDYQAMLECIGRLYQCESLEHFPITALTEILRLVGADSSTFNYVAPCVPKVTAVARPLIPDEPVRTRRFAQYLPQHAALNHFLGTGNPGAFKLSDFQSQREYHALPLYQEFYGELEYEDQFTFMLFPPGAELIGISLARDRRSFKERDRKMLNLLRPHIARAYRHVERVGLMKRALKGEEFAAPAARVTTIRLDAKGRPVEFASEAQQWIRHFFLEGSRNASCLPEVIADWLRHFPPGRALIRECHGQRLRLTMFPEMSDGDGGVLVMALETISNQAVPMAAKALTRREIELLLQVEQGKTNGEVAVALGISPLTVRCHLEHIFEKLKVPNRTAAVAKFRQQCRGHQ